MIKIATIEDEENIRQEIVRYIKKGIVVSKELKLCIRISEALFACWRKI